MCILIDVYSLMLNVMQEMMSFLLEDKSTEVKMAEPNVWPLLI